MAERSEVNFEYDPSVAEFAVSKKAYLTARPNASFGSIATSAIVMNTGISAEPRVLLLQRAASDSLPNKWEPPGGACDDEDETILHAAARELWEEASLQATRIDGRVGDPHHFTLRDGRKVCQFDFVVHVETSSGNPPSVKLDPEEHQCFVWATEEEVKAKHVDGVDLDFTAGEVERTVLLAFDYFGAK